MLLSHVFVQDLKEQSNRLASVKTVLFHFSLLFASTLGLFFFLTASSSVTDLSWSPPGSKLTLGNCGARRVEIQSGSGLRCLHAGDI